MADITPRRLLEFAPFRLPSLEDFEDLGAYFPTIPSGLSVYEDEKNVYVEAAMPGLSPDDIDITFEKGVLWIKGEAKEEEAGKKRKYYRRASRSFSYRVAVPTEVDQNVEPEASYDNGILTVQLAKSERVKPRKIQVKTRGGGKKTVKEEMI
ncbi:Hsp20/alpha crystallin family protein [Patescibacteria group bacterium]|nr:Hsp20/alpha crystallin family protein [Patescibacteria group bacterium]